MQEALHILKKYWGFHEFRPLQWEVISSILNGKDSLSLFPTGGGKSVCFQVPALMAEGICIVISPLIALMEDQVNSLQNKNIKAMALPGGTSFKDLDRKLDNCIYGNYKFLYLSPERLQQDLVRARIKQMNVNFIAVDEAHCISQWGHDFRPAYRTISEVRTFLPEITIAAFTATATPLVVKDILEQLDLKKPVVHKKSFLRSNLVYQVIKTEDKFYKLIQILKKDSAIIYLRSRKATIEISEYLNKNNITATSYHGGLKNEQKSHRFHEWMANRIQVMVATNAFGMGIDKADVRDVIHMNLPESLESYFQEAGRAGRDGKIGKAIILTNKGDIPVLKHQFLTNLPSIEEVKWVYKKLNTYFQIAYGEGSDTTHDFNFSEFCNQYQLNPLKTFNSIQLLDSCSILKVVQHYRKKTEIKISVPGNLLDNYLDENPRYAKLIRVMLRTYGGIFDSLIPINLSVILEKSNTSEEEALLLFQELAEREIIEFNFAQHDAAITFLVPREDDTTINPIARFVKHYTNTKKEKIEAVLTYVENNKVCKQKQLLEYFGEKNIPNCEKCSVCNQAEEKLTKSLMKEIYLNIMELLKEGEKESRQITQALNYSEKAVVKVLALLFEKGIVQRTPANKYKIAKR